MKNTFELIEVENDNGKEHIICEGAFNDCVNEFESMYGVTYYEGVEFNGSKFYIQQI